MSPLIVHSHPPAPLTSPATLESSSTGHHVRSPVASPATNMSEQWRSLSLHDALPEPAPDPERNSSVMFDEAYDASTYHPEPPCLRRLRRDKSRGIIPPRCPTAPFSFPPLRLGRVEPIPSSPLRHVALSSIPNNDPGRSNSSSKSKTETEQPRRKKAVTFSETILVLEIDHGAAVDEQAWAHYPEQARCKYRDGPSPRYEIRRQLRKEKKRMKKLGIRL